jgi:hypothetical protein
MPRDIGVKPILVVAANLRDPETFGQRIDVQ